MASKKKIAAFIVITIVSVVFLIILFCFKQMFAEFNRYKKCPHFAVYLEDGEIKTSPYMGEHTLNTDNSNSRSPTLKTFFSLRNRVDMLVLPELESKNSKASTEEAAEVAS
ncbi:hypothetical protein NEMIN01_1162 [Nematocida minor]|uniref:uncharacterized protein n=1 Tax=Nematocida minor TaxID=1912983 RepID=UPI00221F2212|nr:uncharacterized protein NEMIN01_1162 [Nematocida minor]KAI5190697.1 hypothetical protein NEMIN01_1162 [Nematocida minor]